MENKEHSPVYLFIPIYNLHFIDTKSVDIDGAKIYTVNDFHSIFNKKDFLHPDELYEDTRQMYPGCIITREWASCVYTKELNLVNSCAPEDQKHNDEIIENALHEFELFLIAMRLYKGGNVQINNAYILSNDFSASYNTSISTYIECLKNYSFSKSRICSLDGYNLNKVDIPYILEKKEKIKKALEKLETPINFFMSYYQTTDLAEKIIKLCTVWEASLLNDRRTELTYCLKIRGSYFLGKNLKTTFGTAYDIRSNLLHSGTPPQDIIRKLKNIVCLPDYATQDDVSYMFYFVKNNLEPITRDIINKFVDLHIETGKNLEQLAQSIDDDFFNSFPI